MARSSRARSRSPSHLTHLELASGALGSQEVLTLHDSLNSELGFLGKGKGDEGGSSAGRGGRWLGIRKGAQAQLLWQLLARKEGWGLISGEPPPQGLGTRQVPTSVGQA